MNGGEEKEANLKAKSFCLSIVHTGVTKAISEKTTIDMYETGYAGQLLFCKEVVKSVKSKFPSAVDSIPKVIKVQLNLHNIHDAENAILDEYKLDKENSLFRQMKKSPFYSIMHDGISKYSTEYNGIFLRGLNGNNNPINLPYSLKKMKV